VDGPLTEYTECVIKFTCNPFNRKWNFAQRFLELDYFRALGSGRTLMAITCQRITYILLKWLCKL